MPNFEALVDYLLSAPDDPFEVGMELLDAVDLHLSRANSPESRCQIARSGLAASKRLFERELHSISPQSVAPGEPLYPHFLIAKGCSDVLMQQGHYAECLPILMAVLDATEDDLLAVRYDLPLVLAALGRLPEAREFEEKFRETSGPGLFNLALLDALSGSFEFTEHAVAASAKNVHIAPMLLKKKSRPIERGISKARKSGSIKEAAWYVSRAEPMWALPSPRPGLSALDLLGGAFLKLRSKAPSGGKQGLIKAAELEGFMKRVLSVNFASRTEVLKFVVTEARGLFDREPWLMFNEAPVVVQFPEDNGSIVAAFSGSLGDLKGAFIYGSMESFDLTQELANSSPKDLVGSSLYSWFAESLWLTVQNLTELDPFIRQELKPLATDTHKSSLPVPTMKRRGYLEWRISDAELVQSIIGLYGLFAMASRPASGSAGILRFKLSPGSEVTKKLLEAYSQSRAREEDSKDAPSLGKYQEKLVRAWNSLSPSEEIWELGFVGRLGVVQEKPTSRPAIGICCLAAETSSGFVLNVEATPGDTFLPRLAAKCLVKAMNRDGKRPAKCRLRTSPADEEILKSLGSIIQIEVAPKAPAFEEAALALLARGEQDRFKELH
jgi:hypothetical protein